MQTQSSYKVHLNTICNGELSDPLCDSVHRGLTLVRLLLSQSVSPSVSKVFTFSTFAPEQLAQFSTNIDAKYFTCIYLGELELNFDGVLFAMTKKQNYKLRLCLFD